MSQPNESDGPDDVWARAHEDELLGLTDVEASAVVTAAGFRCFIFDPSKGYGLAAMKALNTVTLFSTEGVIRRVGH